MCFPVSDLLGADRLARFLWVLGLALIASALLLGLLTPDFLVPVERPGVILVAFSCMLALASLTLGALIASCFPRNPVGWIFCGMGLAYGAWRFTLAYADYALLARPGLPLGEQAAWVSTWSRFSVLIALGVFLALLFPGGRLPTRRWRIVTLGAGGGAAMLALGDAVRFGPLPSYYYVHNPFGVRGAGGSWFPVNWLVEVSTIVGGALLVASCLASIAALLIRMRRANGPEHRHLKWFAYAAVPALVSSVVILLDWTAERFGLLFLGRTLSPALTAAESFGLFVKDYGPIGTLTALRLDANLESLAVCALLLVSSCTYVAILNHDLYGVDLAAKGMVRWPQVLAGGAAAGVLPFIFIYLAIYAYVVFYPLLGRGGLDGDRLQQVVGVVSSWGAQVFFFVATFLVAVRVAREVERRVVLSGTLVGLTAVFVNLTTASVIDVPVTPGRVFTYMTLGLAGGYLGGLASRSTPYAGVYRASQRIGNAKDASAVAAAIGEDLGGPGVAGVALWRVVTAMDEAGPAYDNLSATSQGARTLHARAPRFVLEGVWTLGREAWPRGIHPGETGSALVKASGEPSWVAMHRARLRPAEQEAWRQREIRSALLVPLVSTGDALVGILMVTFRRRKRFSRRAGRAYLMVAAQAALALDNLRLIEEARQAGRRTGVLVERQRLAREIHDTLAQGFTGVITNLAAAEMAREPSAGGAASARYLEDAKRIARDSLAEARRLVWALRPQSLDRSSLPEALDRLVKGWSERTGVEARATTNGGPRELLPEVEVALLRTAQEALANIHKHARASAVNVSLTYMEDEVILDVLDDGTGFDPSEPATAVGAQDEGGFGLTAMRERIEQLGGMLVVESATGEGTAIVVELPAIAGESGAESGNREGTQ